MAFKKLNSTKEIKGRTNGVQFEEEMFGDLPLSDQILIKIGTSKEVGVNQNDLKVGTYEGRMFLTTESRMLIHDAIF